MGILSDLLDPRVAFGATHTLEELGEKARQASEKAKKDNECRRDVYVRQLAAQSDRQPEPTPRDLAYGRYNQVSNEAELEQSVIRQHKDNVGGLCLSTCFWTALAWFLPNVVSTHPGVECCLWAFAMIPPILLLRKVRRLQLLLRQVPITQLRLHEARTACEAFC